MKQRYFSGMRATNSRLHLGNYEGALSNWVKLQNEGHQMFCMVADWHSLTTVNNIDVSYNCKEIVKDYIAFGIDPDKSVIFVQSHVKEHAELFLLLSMITPTSWLDRNPTYKDLKTSLDNQYVTYGLHGYPVLQSSDILLYDPDGVCTGKDQLPHLEIGNEIARRFNHVYNTEVFKPYKYIIPEDEYRSKLPGLDMRKMSKSYDNCIYLTDTPDETALKINNAFTTPTKIRKSDPGVPEGCAVCHYLKIYSSDWEKQLNEDALGQRGCVQNKKEAVEVVNEFLRPFREKRKHLTDDYIESVLKQGKETSQLIAFDKLLQIKTIMKIL